MAVQSASSIQAAVYWLHDLLLGDLAIAVAVFAVALVGFGMLVGRFSARSALQAVVGMFVLFGAPAIADGMLASVRSTDLQTDSSPRVSVPAPRLPATPAFDPYAGAVAPTGQ